jgi:hypothetical protein
MDVGPEMPAEGCGTLREGCAGVRHAGEITLGSLEVGVQMLSPLSSSTIATSGTSFSRPAFAVTRNDAESADVVVSRDLSCCVRRELPGRWHVHCPLKLVAPC